jgi:RimJ/RimL family protein N-acetyltransferase/8-oxo-dGTP pyrophosphatase MutT (NUDIX family)
VTAPEPQPTLTDGVVTLRPWREEDIEQAIAGHDEQIAHWFGFPATTPTHEEHRAAIERWEQAYADNRSVVAFVIEAGGEVVGSIDLRDVGDRTGHLSWAVYRGHRGNGYATRAARLLGDYAFTGLHLTRVEAKVEPENTGSIRVATRAGMRREGVRRVNPGSGNRPETTEYVYLARLRDDPPLDRPESFRAMLNSFLPRKRAIAQMLIRDDAGRVLLCRLTYKNDWDLPGGVVEVGESPQVAVSREVEEELALTVKAGPLLLVDWLPPWSGWDDALCLVFDGGVLDPSVLDGAVLQPREIRSVQFCTLEEVREHCADFTARRIESALRTLDGGGSTYTESGRACP